MGLSLSQYIPFVIYIAAIIVILLTIFYRVEYGLLFLVPLLPLQNLLQKIYLLPYGHNLIDYLVISMLIGWFFQRVGDNFIENTAFNYCLPIYMILTYIGLWHGAAYLNLPAPISLEDPRLQDWKNIMLLPILYFIVVNNIKDGITTKRLVYLMLFSVILSSFFFYKEFRHVRHWHYTHDMRVEGTFTYLGPNEFGAFCVMYSAIAYAMLLRSKSWLQKSFFGLVSFAGTYATVYSYSRAAYLAWVVVAAFLLFTWKKWSIVLLFVFVIFIQTIMPVSVMERIEMTQRSQDQIDVSTDDGFFDPSAEGRFDIWKKAIDLWISSPLIGTGYDTFANMHVGGEGRLDTHNNYLKILAELGIIGFVVYLYIYYLSFRYAWSLYHGSNTSFEQALGLGFAACVLANMIVNLTHDNWSYFNLMSFYWVFLALVVKSNILRARSALPETAIARESQ